jgi:hypothetical protein
MTLQVAIAATYRVEISGWDLDERFFVEMTDLEWGEEEKRVHLQHSVRQGAVLFVRFLGDPARSVVYPVAYQSIRVSYQPALHTYEILLKQLLPRPETPDPSEALLN